MIKNVPLLRKSLEHVTAHPEEHDQCRWGVQLSCGTVGCIAYHIAMIARPAGVVSWWNAEPYIDGVHVSVIAQEELGLNGDQPYSLFSAVNTLDDLWDIAQQLTDGEVTREEP